MKKWIPLLYLLIMMLVVGCASQKATTGPSETPTTPVTQTPSNSSEPAEPSSTTQSTFSFAVTGTFKPFNFEENGKLTGFDLEIGEEIARRLDMEPQPVKEGHDTILQGLSEGKYQAVISSLSITPERSKKVAFTKPYYQTGAQWFIGSENTAITAAEQIQGKKAGVVLGSNYKVLAEQKAKSIKEYPDHVTLLRELAAGKIDAVLIDKMVGLTAIKEEGLKIKPVGSLLFTDEVAIAVNATNQELVAQINQALEAMIQDGTFATISQKWFGVDIRN